MNGIFLFFLRALKRLESWIPIWGEHDRYIASWKQNLASFLGDNTLDGAKDPLRARELQLLSRPPSGESQRFLKKQRCCV